MEQQMEQIQQMEYTMDELVVKKIKLEIKNEKESAYKYLKDNMPERSKWLLQLSRKKGVFSWHTMLPMADCDFEMSKHHF